MNPFKSIEHLPPEKVKSVAMYFAQKNLSVSEIAKKVGISLDETNEIIFRLKLQGKLPEATRSDVATSEMVNGLGRKLSEAMGLGDK